jgi:ABC-type ATPase involved in cell division
VSLLSLKGVTHRYRRGRVEYVALRDVALDLESGELVGVRGVRRSGRSTLLRVAAGIEFPEEGTVCFEGQDLAVCRNRVLGTRIGYVHTSFSSVEAGLVVEHVATSLLAQHASPRIARRRAEAVLDRVGAADCAGRDPCELDGGEIVRVSIARALITEPGLLVVDEPTSGVGLLQRDPILALLRSIANDGVAVLMCTGDASDLSGFDHAMSIDAGELKGVERQPDGLVVPLRPPGIPTPKAEPGTGTP